MEKKDPFRGLYIFLTLICDHPYLVSSLFAILLCLHLNFFNVFLLVYGIVKSAQCHGMATKSTHYLLYRQEMAAMPSSLSEMIQSKMSANGLALIFSASYAGDGYLPGYQKGCRSNGRGILRAWVCHLL